MKNMFYVLSASGIFIINLFFCSSLCAGPVINAQQFQQKTVATAFKGSKQQNFETKKESIEWIKKPASTKKDNKKNTDNSMPINIKQ